MDTGPFSQRLIHLMPQLIRGFARQEHNSLSRGEITLPQLWALELLARYPRIPSTTCRQGVCPMHDLARSLNISRPAATGLIHRLIKQGLAVREHDRRDRRVVRVGITAKGRKILTEIWEQKRRAIAKVFGQLPGSDRARYLSTLERVVAILNRPAADDA